MLSIGFLLIVQLLFSQNHKIDSLKIALQKHKAKDTVRVNMLNQLALLSYKENPKQAVSYAEASLLIANAIHYKKGGAKSWHLKGKAISVYSNYTDGFQYYSEALQLYAKIDFTSGLAECYNDMGTFFYYEGKYNDAVKYYLKSITHYQTLANSQGVSSNLLFIGSSYLQLGNYPKAVSYYEKSLTICKQTNDQKGMSRAYNSLGAVHSYQANYHLALKYHNESLSINKAIKDTLSMSFSLTNIGVIHFSIKNYDKAISYYNESIKYHRKKSNKQSTAELLNNLGLAYKEKREFKTALEKFKEALEIFKEHNIKAYIGICLNNIGDIYFQLNDVVTANYYFKEAIKTNLELDNALGLCNSYLGLAKVYFKQKKYTDALTNAMKSKEISKKLKLINYQSEVTHLLSAIYKQLEDYPNALENHEQYKILSDSLLNEENIKKIAAIEYEYKYKKELDDAEKRETKLTKTVETTTKDLEKSQRNLLLGIISFLVIALVLGSVIFYLKLRNSKAKTQNIITEQKLLRTQMTPHFIFNSLSVLQGMILNKEESKSVNYLSKFSKLLRITLENSRDKTVLLSQELEAIENYLSLQNIENEKINFQLDVDKAIGTNTMKVPPMLIQPFVENAIEHAFKKQKEDCKIEIKLTLVNAKLICVILDNGMGIDSSERNTNQNKKSLATKITKERLDYLSKDFKMESSISIEDRSKFNEKGTQVTIQIPYSKTVL